MDAVETTPERLRKNHQAKYASTTDTHPQDLVNDLMLNRSVLRHGRVVDAAKELLLILHGLPAVPILVAVESCICGAHSDDRPEKGDQKTKKEITFVCLPKGPELQPMLLL